MKAILVKKISGETVGFEIRRKCGNLIFGWGREPETLLRVKEVEIEKCIEELLELQYLSGRLDERKNTNIESCQQRKKGDENLEYRMNQIIMNIN